jgi:hypothetical protein
MSKSAGVQTHYRVELYAAELLTRAAETQVNANGPASSYVTIPSLPRRSTASPII